jgi:hypothetical protein
MFLHISFPQARSNRRAGAAVRNAFHDAYMDELALRLHTRHAREMMSLGNEAVENERAQGLTVPVAAGAAVVLVVLCSAIYSVLHYLF